MTLTNPQFLYMILILPSIFGLALVGEGVNKLVHQEWSGMVSIVSGVAFIGIVIVAYLVFSAIIGNK